MQHTILVPYTSILAEYGIDDLAFIEKSWTEPHRFYHTLTHLQQLLQDIEQLHAQGQISGSLYKILVVAAIFHDIVYNPQSKDNEQASAELFNQLAKPSHPDVALVSQIILDTQTHKAQSEASKIFQDLDLKILKKGSFYELLQWEKAIMKEYQYWDYSLYKIGRKQLLLQWIEEYPENALNLQALLDYLTHHKPQIGIYAGSFNPFHNGHYNILQKAERIFDKVIVARGVNPEKMQEAKAEKKSQALAFRQTEDFCGLLTDYLKIKEAVANITLVRGLRNGDDLDYEVNQLRFMEEMKPDLKIVFIPCDSHFEHISSSAIKNLEKITAGLSKKYIPD